MTPELGFVFSEKYLQHETGNHPENKGRLTAILEAVEENGLDSKLLRLDPAPATVEQIALIHHIDYIHSVQKAWDEGHRRLDPDTIVCSESYFVALLAAGATVTAVDMVLDDKIKRAFCAVRPPGHHAERHRAMGFCLFNNAAIGAEYAIRSRGLQKVFILDWDVHHGNGTQNSFYRRGDIYYASIHQWPNYPGTGLEKETGEGEGLGANRNFPLSPFQGDDAYISIFKESIIPEILRFSPDLVMISAGFDAHESDFLASMNVSTEGFGRMTEMVAEAAEKVCGGKIVSVLEGGYHLKALGDSVAIHLEKMMDV